MRALLNANLGHSGAMDSMQPHTHYAVVTSVDPDSHSCAVLIQPHDVEMKWIPYEAVAIGGGVTISAPPSVGDQVVIAPMAGDHEDWHVVGRAPSTQARPAVSPATGKPAQSGEFLIGLPGGLTIHGSGGKWFIYGPFEIHGNGTLFGNLDIYGNLTAHAADGTNGDISDAHGTLDRLRGNYDGHKHTGVRAGSDTSAQTTQPDAE